MMVQSSSHTHEQYLKKKWNRKMFRYGVATFLIVFIVGLLGFIAHRPNIRISNVELTGNVLVSQADIASSSLSYIAGSYLWLFPKNNFLLYPRIGLESYLKETFKRIDSIHISKKGFDTIVVSITERKPEGIWCDKLLTSQVPTEVQPSASEGVLSAPARTCYFLDEQSVIFAEAPDFSGDAYFKYYGLIATSPDVTPIGKLYVASSTQFTDISSFVENVRKFSLKPLSLLGKDDGDFSLTIFGGGQIYFDMKESLSKVAENLEALLRTPDLSKGISNLDYIDLRFGNKLYYKLK